MRRAIILGILVSFLIVAGIFVGKEFVSSFKELHESYSKDLAVVQLELLNR